MGYARRWSPDEQRRLKELVGTMPAEAIGELLGREFGYPRTRHAVKIRASRLGLSVWPLTWSMQEVSRLFGIDSRVIERWWIQPGLLVGTRWRTPRPGDARWSFLPADVEAFIRQYPWAYEPGRMQRHHRLAQLAEIIHRADPWLPWAEVACYLGYVPGSKYWLRRGLVPHQRRSGNIVVRARDLPAITDAIAKNRQQPLRKRSTVAAPRVTVEAKRRSRSYLALQAS